jgi:hypothetical protein
MEIVLYILYALVQAILLARYAMPRDDSPVGMVVIMALFAPIASVITIGSMLHFAIKWLVTYKR